jgi:hypothetical protein
LSGPEVLILDQTIQMHSALIRNRQELDDFMRMNTGSMNPLNQLSPDGRRRFLAGLDFDELSQGGFPDTFDIEAELTLSQAWRLLGLFGAQWAVELMPDIRVESKDDRAIDQWRQAFAHRYDKAEKAP